jgi:hypothetical protein
MPTDSASAPSGSFIGRILRLHSFEFLIFAVLFALLAMCIASAPFTIPRTQKIVARNRRNE